MTIPNKFPDIAECYYNVTGVAGGSNVSNGLCFCSMNTVIEKTVLISWVWIVVITSMNVFKILVQVTLFLIPPLRAQFLLFKVYFFICCKKKKVFKDWCVKIRAERAKNWVSNPTYLTHAHTLKNSKITPVMLAFKNSQKIFQCNTKIAD